MSRKCSRCTDAELKCLTSLPPLRQYKCKGCGTIFFFNGDEPCDGSDFYREKYRRRKANRGESAPRERKPRKVGVYIPQVGPTLKTGHSVEEVTPGHRIYRMKI